MKKRDRSLGLRLGRIVGCAICSLAIVFCVLMMYRNGNETIMEVVSLSEELSEDSYRDLKLSPKKPVVIRDAITGLERKIYGRFLHITDMHPDAFYKEGSSIENVCHEGKPKNTKDRAPRFGYATGGCDSPPDLVNYTLEWITENLRDKIDFVIWTGDNVRHDNDRRIPRTEFQILDMNELISGKIQKLFSNPNSENPRDFDVSVVPSIGNNDVFPHNMFALGPTLQTREYHRIWNNLVPQEQQRTFDRSASFATEVIPGKLAVLSINTLYLFKANPLVDNCNSKKQPGYQILLWLGAVLEEFRQRGMKVWLSGHVPPIEKNFAEGCFDKYTLWTHEYRDIIIGGLYGHMNMDHFIPVDGEASWEAIKQSEQLNTSENQKDDDDDLDMTAHAMAGREAHLMGAKPVGKEAYMNRVRERIYERVHQKIQKAKPLDAEGDDYDAKRKSSKSFDEICEDYSIVSISGSVIPTFNPSLRVWEYNITDLDTQTPTWQSKSWDQFYKTLENIMERDSSDIENEHLDDPEQEFETQRKKKKKRGKKPKEDKTIPRKKPKNLPLGPAYEPQLFSPTRFVQLYADLKRINKKYYSLLEAGKTPDEAAGQAFQYEVEYASDDDPYPMKGLLVKDFVLLASKLATQKKSWNKFMERAFMSTGYTD
ncbi:hypothetical protein HG537_0A05840 [Torulaspora globosa]|uniref:Endopolyphosphatase n=1 Tax=Torulaspora globosa TaxID=48254 RepID=A0A7H9HNK9_9SACH|nr:hypothetical protein HG537_0A05840 [Torulaspora sp. CBS 2947]